MTWHRPADFDCERGMVRSRPPDAQGYSEGGGYEIRIEMVLGRLSDGSLLFFNSTHYTSKTLLVFRSTRRTATSRALPSKIGDDRVRTMQMRPAKWCEN